MANIIDDLRKPWTMAGNCTPIMRNAADEIERLKGLLHAHGIDPGSEFICSCGIRREPKQKKPDF